jgi:hypothetical protein
LSTSGAPVDWLARRLRPGHAGPVSVETGCTRGPASVGLERSRTLGMVSGTSGIAKEGPSRNREQS